MHVMHICMDICNGSKPYTRPLELGQTEGYTVPKTCCVLNLSKVEQEGDEYSPYSRQEGQVSLMLCRKIIVIVFSYLKHK